MARILIVDDEKSIRRTLGEFLRAEGYEVLEAEEADAAQQRLREAEFDVVVSDIILPRVTGVELLRRIHQTSPHVQVVMMTGEPTVETATESLRAGAVDYLFKPISKAAILRAVANAARIKTLEDTRRRLEAENQAHRENLERLVAERTVQLRQSEARAQDLSRFNQAALDALTAHICVLAEDGAILAVNRAWSDFLRDNPPPARNANVGGNYFAACDAVTDTGRPAAQEAVSGLRAVARGDVPEFSLEYPCHSPDEQRWFLLRATRFGGEGPARIVVAHVNITQRRLAEEALWAERNLLRTLVDSLPVAAYAKDLEGRKTLVNPVDAYNLSVASPADALGKTDFDFFPRAEAEQFWADDQAALREGKLVLNREEHITRRDGSTAWLLTSKVPLRDAAGQVTGLVGIGVDITARKRAERISSCFAQLSWELSSTLDALQAVRIVAKAAQDLLTWDCGFMVLRSADLCRIEHALHWDTFEGNLVEVPPHDACSEPTPSEQRVRAEGAFLVLRKPGEPSGTETLPFGDATRRPESLLFVPVRYQNRYLGMFSAQSYQPNAYTHADLNLLQALADHCAGALERIRTEARLRKLARAVEQSPASIIITDCAGNIEFVNPKFMQVTGYGSDEILGKNPRLLKSGETSAEEYRRLWQTITSGQEWHGEFHNKRKDGALFWETASISPIRDANGAITHFVAVKEDVTEKKLTEAKFLRAQRVESIGSLASGIAHDLNNILAPIIMCAPMLGWDEPPETRKELGQTIEASAQRAAGIVKQLLTFARGKEGQKQRVQVRYLVRDMAKIARETFPRSIHVHEECARDLWTVLADATQIHQVLLNLCVNARDAMPHGGKLIIRAENVTLDEHYVSMHKDASPGPFARIQVEDTGTGIPEELRDRIFESFFTTKGEGEGTGLGLTTVQGIVKDHKGFGCGYFLATRKALKNQAILRVGAAEMLGKCRVIELRT